MSFLLSADSTCDLFKSYMAENNVFCIPLAYIHGGREYRDDFNSDGDYRGFYRLMRSGVSPTTAQINEFEAAEFFEKILADNKGDIVHIGLSRGLSNGGFDNTCAGAGEAMKKFPGRKIYCVDSFGATRGAAALVDAAIEMRGEGKTAKETAAALEALVKRGYYAFMVSDLSYLKRSGRISAAAAVVGTILNIKPILTFNAEGKMDVVDKVKGVNKALNTLIEMAKKNGVDFESQCVYIAHSDAYETACALRALVERELKPASVKIGWVGPIVGSHTGPGLVGMFYLGNPRKQ